MQKLSVKLLSLLVVFSTLLSAKVIDLEKSKGINQDLIISLNPYKAQKDVSQDTDIKVKFDIELDEVHVKKHDVKLKLIRDKKDSNIKGTVTYITEEKAVLFKPNRALENGYYEVEFKSLKALKKEKRHKTSEKKKKIYNIKYRFYVPQTINGYKLPPEPDATTNNSTLLGIDFNDNGVRDDVERKVIETYKEPIKIELMMARAKVAQEILENPIGLAIEHSNKMSRILSCQMFLKRQNIKIKNGAKKISNFTYTTKERVRTFLDHNLALSGGVYGSSPSDWNAQACDFDVEEMLKDIK